MATSGLEGGHRAITRKQQINQWHSLPVPLPTWLTPRPMPTPLPAPLRLLLVEDELEYCCD